MTYVNDEIGLETEAVEVNNRAILPEGSNSPLLSPVQERELATRYRRESLAPSPSGEASEAAIAARNQLVCANLRLVANLARKYSKGNAQDLMDIFQEGSLGLLRATEKYDPELGYRFSTYATWWIKQAILEAVSERLRPVRLPVTVLESLQKLRRLREALPKELGREADQDELRRTMGISEQRFQTLMGYEELFEGIASIYSQVSSDDDQEAILLDNIKDELSQSPEELVERKLLLEDLEHAMQIRLTQREAYILRHRFAEDFMTLSELADTLSLSTERVRQIENKALQKLKASLEPAA